MIINSITKKEKYDVYDIINVKDNNNYIANNFIVHNSSADWAKKESKELRKKLATVRTKHLLFILCFPLKIHKMEKNYLESFVNYWCVTKNTNINIINKKTKKESIKKLKNINPITDNILSFKQTCGRSGGYKYKEFKDVLLTKENMTVYELKLTSGDKIKASLDHPFLTLNGWKRMEDISLIDSIRCFNLGNGLSFSQVISIKKLSKKEDVYDIIGVKDNHNFVANNMVVHNCDLFGRGVGAIYVKDRNPSADPWRVKDFKMVGAYTEFTKLSNVEKKLKKHPNFWQIIKFPKPPAWLYSKYLEVREKNVYNDATVRDMVTTEDIHKALLVLALQDVMMNDTTLSMNRIILHIKNRYDIPITKKHIQSLLLDAKQLVTKIREESVT